VSHFRPKEVLHRAQKSEKEGLVKEAAKSYALLSVYLRKKNKYPDAEKMIAKAIKLNPDSGRLYLEESACFLGMNDESRASASIQKCVQIGLEKKQLHVYFSHLHKHLTSNSWIRQKFCELWLSIDRTSPTPFLGLGEELLGQGKWQEARDLFLKGLFVEPTNETLLTALVSLMNQHGSPTEQDYLKRFLDKSLSLEQFMVLMGKPTDVKNERPKSSREVETAPELKELGELISELEKELEISSETEYENVEPVIQEFLRKSNQVIGSDLQARLDLAFAFFEMDRLREAKMELNHIQTEHLLFGQAQYLLGTILLQEGSDVAALGAFQSALRSAVKDSAFWKETVYQLVKLNLKLGDLDTAGKFIQQLEKTDPGYRDLKNLRKNVRKEPA